MACTCRQPVWYKYTASQDGNSAAGCGPLQTWVHQAAAKGSAEASRQLRHLDSISRRAVIRYGRRQADRLFIALPLCLRCSSLAAVGLPTV